MSFRRHLLDSDTSERFRLLQPGETITMVGRCPTPRCRHGIRLELPGVITYPPDSPHHRFGHRLDHGDTRVLDLGYTIPEGHSYMWTAAHVSNHLREDHRCPDCLLPYTFKELRAVTISTVACSEACEEATGEKCRCSCGGANHAAAAR